MKVYIADAFTWNGTGGNRAGVVILPEGATFLSDEEMLRTAARLHYSETAFVRMLEESLFQIRYFTPVAEVELCGHATVASFKVLRHLGRISGDAHCRCRTQAGEIGIDLSGAGAGERIFMDMAAPERIAVLEDSEALSQLYAVMGLDAAAQSARGLRLLPEIISTGLPDILLPVASLEDLSHIAPDFKALAALSAQYRVVGVHAFTAACEDATCHVRNFAPLYGIDEEAATGTSNGALTYYGLLNGFVREGQECVFIQGEKMNRTSLILSRVRMMQHVSSPIQVGGAAVLIEELDL